MGRSVYVFPVTLMSGIYSDLHGESPVDDVYNLMHAKMKNLQGEDGFRSSMLLTALPLL